ncbi:23S rRNA (guanine2445-N2)-methyltransferase/23S rRNA (guanine2069-N7)-methyltransferase [Bathymodiolus japonicus methanotrophic gill symbiont]|uniref:bifunctional 23S rRNA (guanine(2069)-N(7))-methyltransferase RlmK/23S rRNA (guanine(2445)-N(2))-methyltransferase RlmL n=1 Tax=Bathymodiolus japonicus methanotrophic gill symbiont TaxID=113269 RepID=UPI001B45EAF9|nr:bifunctional 23S rRNA (guanine(2069)-N(7))-methyltransferase RlmK/23S rRNA (guanine(2445)-N(2))-methyltransferase RlmL [Bathymodiolus japonicus methanotrophic gill symbiont]GFO71059.1 23S rRNA (guanine2445-N2)-methyltransferase/23S rRNA (guanine2069-N7)-methyltransferase [Bathymodiolus japonicus methanotrophic gill symbiont]
MTNFNFFATTPKAMEDILVTELKQLGAKNVKAAMAGAYFEGSLEVAYRVCLWSRIANRVLLTLSSFIVTSQEDLYAGIYKINWFEHMTPDDSFAVSFNAKGSKAINNTHFGAIKVKDAVVDQMRKKSNKRPDINTTQPNIRINVYLHNEQATLSLDLSGESLHRRGYRDLSITAPIKENLAAAILNRSHWLDIAQQGGSLIDPMCGSGTMLIEAAMIAGDYAPGLQQKQFGFSHWKQHDAALWQSLLDEASQRKQAGLEKIPTIVGFDQSRRAINAALLHIENAGLQEHIHVERRDISAATAAESWQPGLVVCNPPYGERLGNSEETAQLYRTFGEVLKQQFTHWQAAMIISDPELGFRLGIRSQKPITLFNGPLECKLLRFAIEEQNFFIPKAKSAQERIEQIKDDNRTADPNADMFANRLQKNIKKTAKWLKRNNIHCYRIYDADLPEYAIAIDVYQGAKTWLNVQEYQAPKSISQEKAMLRLSSAVNEIARIFALPKEQIYLKTRSKQKGMDQYEKLASQGTFETIEEHGALLHVNFEDYLDTGLFLDHRPLRLKIQQQAKNKHFLNLFAYTGTASVHAAIGGAITTTTVDMSKTYLDWAQRNMALNNSQSDNRFIRADCMEWLKSAANKSQPDQLYDLIFLDPPTFSNSKRMENNLSIQEDHVALISHATKSLSTDGILYFSTNFRRFKLDMPSLAHLHITDISAQTIPEDFSRSHRIHYCWEIKCP